MSSHPLGHRAGTGPQGWSRAVPSVCGGCLAGLEHADLQGRLQRLICLLRHFAGERHHKRAEFHLSPAIPPPAVGFVLELLINCWMFRPKGCCWGTFDCTGSAVAGGLRSRREHLQQRATKPCEGSGTCQRASRALSPTMVPAKSCCFGGQVLAGSCAKLWVNIWEGEKLARTARGERAGRGPLAGS